MTEFNALLLTFLLGIIYNALYERFAINGELASLWVVGGVFFTLLISSTVTTPDIRLEILFNNNTITLSNAQHAAFHVFKFFCASGTPMVLGAIRRSYISFWRNEANGRY